MRHTYMEAYTNHIGRGYVEGTKPAPRISPPADLLERQHPALRSNRKPITNTDIDLGTEAETVGLRAKAAFLAEKALKCARETIIDLGGGKVVYPPDFVVDGWGSGLDEEGYARYGFHSNPYFIVTDPEADNKPGHPAHEYIHLHATRAIKVEKSLFTRREKGRLYKDEEYLVERFWSYQAPPNWPHSSIADNKEIPRPIIVNSAFIEEIPTANPEALNQIAGTALAFTAELEVIRSAAQPK